MKDSIGLVLVLAGAVLLGIGVFLPLLSAPYGGAVTLITSGDSPRIIMFAMAILALALGLAGQARHALWPGLLALGAIIWGYIRVQDKIEDFEARFGDGLVGRLAERATDTIRYESGWVILIMGSVLILAGALIAWLWRQRDLPPSAQPAMVAIGAVMVGAGIFLPLVVYPRISADADVLGSVVPRVVLAAAGLAALFFAAFGWARHALWPGLVGMVALVITYVQVLTNIQAVQARIEGLDDRFGDGVLGKIADKAVGFAEKRYGDDLLGKAADKATELIQLQWGWAILTIGLTLIVVAAARIWLQRVVVAPPVDVSQTVVRP